MEQITLRKIGASLYCRVPPSFIRKHNLGPGDFLDPLDKEKSEDAKTRYLNQLNGDFAPKPTVKVDSGNGIQCLWKLESPIV